MQQQDYATRLEILERTVLNLQKQLDQYVPVKENDLKLQIIKDTVEQIKKEVVDIRGQIKGVDDKLVLQNMDAQKRQAELRESQDKLQIRVLTYIIGTIVTVGGLILVGYATHFFH